MVKVYKVLLCTTSMVIWFSYRFSRSTLPQIQKYTAVHSQSAHDVSVGCKNDISQKWTSHCPSSCTDLYTHTHTVHTHPQVCAAVLVLTLTTVCFTSWTKSVFLIHLLWKTTPVAPRGKHLIHYHWNLYKQLKPYHRKCVLYSHSTRSVSVAAEAVMEKQTGQWRFVPDWD